MIGFRRAQLIAVASLTLAAQLAGLAHEAFVPHAVCAEHGEWIEQDGNHGPGHIDGVDSLTRGGDPAIEAPGHEHCAVIAHRRTASRVSGIYTVIAVSPPRQSLPAVSHLATFGGLAPLVVAPKASPPSVA
ncbi:MAG: hypothetical protein QM723_19195 [Myxococcaceae bacterium]